MSFFGALGQLGRLLPGFVQGERQAVADNWQDLTNYNNVLNGQLSNAFNVVTWPQQLQSITRAAQMQQLALEQSQRNSQLQEILFPYQMKYMPLQYEANYWQQQQNNAISRQYLAAMLAQINQMNQWRQQQQQQQQPQQQPQLTPGQSLQQKITAGQKK